MTTIKFLFDSRDKLLELKSALLQTNGALIADCLNKDIANIDKMIELAIKQENI
jgi:hypothetical protein